MINKRDIDLLESISNILSSIADYDYEDNILNLFNDYVDKQKILYNNRIIQTRAYINEKRKTNPLYARSKTEIEKYNRVHNIGGTE